MTASALISSHLNAPFGPILMQSDVLDSLTNGCLSGKTEMANAILGSLFAEIDPRLIAECALEAGTTIKQAHLLYLDTLTQSFPPCPQWEAAVEHLV